MLSHCSVVCHSRSMQVNMSGVLDRGITSGTGGRRACGKGKGYNHVCAAKAVPSQIVHKTILAWQWRVALFWLVLLICHF